jgi:sortase A
MKKHLSTIILILIFLVGLSLVLYPTIADYWNSLHQSRAIATYAEEVAHIDTEKYTTVWQTAIAYNRNLRERDNIFILSDEQKVAYDELLNIGGNGVMGYIEIPSIGVSLPVYHGTDEAVLQIAIGHLEWTSLPVGGESTHSVVSGHTGLPSAKLFTNLNQLTAGDTFLFRILDETLTYEVDQIKIVLPHETDDLLIQDGKDLCTLVTCTPYGVNSHRLLVRGHRVENAEIAKTIRVTADAMQIEPLIVAPLVAVPMLIVLLIMVLFGGGKKKERRVK